MVQQKKMLHKVELLVSTNSATLSQLAQYHLPSTTAFDYTTIVVVVVFYANCVFTLQPNADCIWIQVRRCNDATTQLHLGHIAHRTYRMYRLQVGQPSRTTLTNLQFN